MLISHRIALQPSNRQKTYLGRACGVARFAFNWGLAEWKKQYEAWKLDSSLEKPSQLSLRRKLNSIKREQFPWMLEVTKCAPQLALIQLGKAFENFFKGRAAFPRFHKKGIHDSFSISNDQFSVVGKRIRIPSLGWVRMREQLRFNGKIMSATVSRTADRWYASITVDTPEATLSRTENQGAVGVDLGISSLAVLSTGEKIEGARPLKALLSRQVRLSRSLSRKKKGSSNYRKARMELAKLHARIACIRSDGMHKLTTSLARRFNVIGIEDLNVRGMMSNHHLARSIADAGFFEFRRQLEYKGAMTGARIIVADRWFASSRTCSACGALNEKLTLNIRQWTCESCGARHDRDVNAAMNLKNLAASSAVTACGEESSGASRKGRTKLASMKQEVSFNHI